MGTVPIFHGVLGGESMKRNVVAAVLSAIVPGVGQLYNRCTLAVVF